MADHLDDLELALLAFATERTPARITKALATGGREGLALGREHLAPHARVDLEREALQLQERGIGVTMVGDPDFPAHLMIKGRPAAPILFLAGNRRLLHAPGIGMCGSRAVSDLGLKAADACGRAVSVRGLTVVSGYARGVDTATHLAALRSGGSTVIVLAEGFDHFRIKRDFQKDFDWERVLVMSQFPPSQPWGAYAAMGRNKIIYGLSEALVVIEAGEKGGTLAAGEGALGVGRPLLVLDFGQETPIGNQKLLRSGGRAIASTAELDAALDQLAREEKSEQQDPLF